MSMIDTSVSSSSSCDVCPKLDVDVVADVPGDRHTSCLDDDDVFDFDFDVNVNRFLS